MFASVSIALFLAVWFSVEAFFLLFNAYVAFWYTLVIFVILIPLYVAVVFLWNGSFA